MNEVFRLRGKRETCSKCKGLVDPSNSGLYFAAARHAYENGLDPARTVQQVGFNPMYLFMHGERHILPTESCEGSPSLRSQVIDGMISYSQGRRLPREEWRPLPADTAEAARKAYAFIQTIQLAPLTQEEQQMTLGELCDDGEGPTETTVVIFG